MNLKILGLFGVLAVAAYPVWTVVATDDVEEVADDEFEEFDIDESDDAESAEQKVVARTTCEETKKRIAELQAMTNPEDADLEELEYLQKRQRSQCAAKGRSRPVRNYANRGPQMEVVEEEIEEEVVVEKPKKKTKKKVESETKTETPEPVKTQKEIDDERAANLANGLCGDGAKPNKFGCCDGEKFKDLGNLKFACCPKEGDGECHAPIKK